MFHRRSVRLRGFDYSQNAWYFVTICTQKRECLFGKILDGKLTPTSSGLIVESVWKSLPIHHPVTLDTFQIMPNHFHGIIVIDDNSIQGGSRPAPTLGNIIGLFKSECTKKIRTEINDQNRLIWQRGFYEHIIRTENAYLNIQRYIVNNPVQWDDDIYHNDS